MEDRNSAYASRTFKKDKYAWYGLIIFILVSIGVGRAFRENDRAQLRPWKSSVTHRATITVLEYDRVVLDKSKDHIDPDNLRRQLKALEEDGFEAVSLTDILKFYYEDKKLPEKSVLLIFANGYLETYAAVDPILREIKWPATMTIITRTIVKKETFFLYWDRLRRMVNSGVWSLASGEIPDDYKVSQNLIEVNIPGYKMLAHSPLVDDAHNHIKISSQLESREGALRKFYLLEFVNSFAGVNDKNSDPFRLRRLRVKPEWSPKTLLILMNQGIQAVSAENKTRAESIWFRSDGELVETSPHRKHHPKQNSRLAGTPNAERGIRLNEVPGAGIFFPGSNKAGNWILEADIRLDRGEFWIRQNSSEAGNDWRVGGNSENFNAQVRFANGPHENLASSREGVTPGKWRHLRLVKRGKGIILNWEGRLLWDLPVPAPDHMHGDIGLWAWSEEGEGSLRLSDARISFFPDDIRWLENYPKEDAVQFLVRQSEQVSGVTTITHTVQENQVMPVSFDKDLFQIISYRYGWKFIPTIQILPKNFSSEKPDSENVEKKEFRNLEIFSTTTIKALVKQNHWTHVHLDLSRLSGERKEGWFSGIAELNHELEKINCRLLVTTEARPDVSKSLKFKLPLLENDSE